MKLADGTREATIYTAGDTGAKVEVEKCGKKKCIEPKSIGSL